MPAFLFRWLSCSGLVALPFISLPFTATARAQTALVEPELTQVGADRLEMALPRQGTRIQLDSFDADGDPAPLETIHVRQHAPGIYVIEAARPNTSVWSFHLHDPLALFQLLDDTERPRRQLRKAENDGDLLLHARAKPTQDDETPRLPVVVSRSGVVLGVSRPAGANVQVRFEVASGDTVLRVTGPQLRLALLADVPLQKALRWLSETMDNLPIPESWAMMPLNDNDTEIGTERRLLPFSLTQALVPYHAEASRQWASSGVPVMRPVSFDVTEEHPAEYAHEFFYGDDLLVAAARRSHGPERIALPQGEWVNFWTGLQSAGGRSLGVEAPSSVPAIWVRSGSVIPLRQAERTEYAVFPGPTSNETWNMAEADGHTLRRKADSLEITGGPPQSLQVRWRFVRVKSAWVNGQAVRVQRDADGSFVDLVYADQCSLKWE